MKTRRVYFSGWSGQRNAGDDAFAIVVPWGLRKYQGTEEFVIEQDASGLPAKYCPFHHVQPKGNWLPGLPRFRRAYFQWLCDTLVLSGGTLLPNIYEVRRLTTENQWRKGNRSTIALGLSVGPFQSTEHERMTAAYLKQLRFIGFRDDFSYDWALANGIDTRFARAFDLALLLPFATGAPAAPRKDAETVIGISLLSRHSTTDSRLSDRDIDFVDKLVTVLRDARQRTPFQTIVFSLCRNALLNDDPIVDAFAQRFSDGSVEVVRHDGDAEQTYRQLQRCSHVVSMRLHGAIFSYLAGIPCLTLEYQRKCRDFAETIGNDSRLCLSMDSFDEDHFRDAFNFLLVQSSSVTNLSVEQAQQRALLNFQF